MSIWRLFLSMAHKIRAILNMEKKSIKTEVEHFYKIVAGKATIETMGEMPNLIARWQELINFKKWTLEF